MRESRSMLVDRFTNGLAFWRSPGFGIAPSAGVGMPVLDCIAMTIDLVPKEVLWSYLWVATEEMHARWT